MTDFGTVPPEITSGQIHTGPGPGSMLAASLAWTEVAAELHATATSYWSSVTALTDRSWLGESSAAMAAAALPYAAWLRASADQADRMAGQVQAATAAFDTVFAMTVPPTLVAANRAALAVLIATNVLGQNAPAIATNEAAYDEMWAQDAAAMYLYAASSANATTIQPFGAPPPTTTQPNLGSATAYAHAGNAASTYANASEWAASQTLSETTESAESTETLNAAVPPASPTAPDPSSSMLSSLSSLNALSYPARFATYPVNFLSKALGFSKSAAAPAGAVTAGATAAGLAAPAGIVSPATAVVGPASSTANAPAISAGLAEAHRFGPLSVPSSWSAPAAQATTAGSALVPGGHFGGASTIGTSGGAAGTPVMPVGNFASRGAATPTPRYELRPTVIPRSPAAG